MDERIRDPLPSLYAEGGYLSFDLFELWQLLAEKLPADQLAENMMATSGSDVRQAFIRMVLRKYDTFSDEERRAIMEALQYHVHNAALDRAVAALTALEGAAHQHAYYMLQKATFARYLAGLKDTLREIAPEALERVEARHGVDPFDALKDAGAEASSQYGAGKLWYETREHWRKRCEELFLTPPVPPKAPPTLPDIVSDDLF